MPVSFGSVGDVISVSLLVKDLLQALSSSRGAAAEYQEVVRELNVLDSGLLEVERLARTHEATPELTAICEIAKRTVDKSRMCVDVFTKRIKKYGHTFDTGDPKPKRFLKFAARSVEWQIKREDVHKFRAEIMSYSGTIHTLVGTAHMSLLSVSSEDIGKRISASEQRSQASLDHQEVVLNEIKQRIEESKQLIADGNTLSSRMIERWNWMKQLTSEIKGFMQRIMNSNFDIYRELVAIRKAVARPSRPLPEEYFVLEDPIGRVAPIHLRLITSWKAFDAVVEARFENTRGYIKVMRKEYTLQEQDSGAEVDRLTPWDAAFIPGQRINMFILFHSNRPLGAQTGSSCPFCQTESDHAAELEIQCSRCKKWYQRIVGVEDAPTEPTVPLPKPWMIRPKFGSSSFEPLIGPKPAKKRPAEDSEDEDDLNDFRRVKLISRAKRVKFSTAFKKLSLSNPLQSICREDSHIPPWANGSPIPREAGSEVSLFRNAQDVAREFEKLTAEKSQSAAAAVLEWISGPIERDQKAPENRPASSHSEARKSKSPSKATEEDARKVGVAAAHSFKSCNIEGESLYLLGSVFDANSFGKWIYDWTVFRYATISPISVTAGDLWLLLVEVASKIQLGESALNKISATNDREMVEDILKSGRRLWIRFNDLLGVCERYIWSAAKRESNKPVVKVDIVKDHKDNEHVSMSVANVRKDNKPLYEVVTNQSEDDCMYVANDRKYRRPVIEVCKHPFLGRSSAFEFINSIFGPERELKKTQDLMRSMHLWSMRFETYCDEILRILSA